jgi:signal transduction histidine kinase
VMIDYRETDHVTVRIDDDGDGAGLADAGNGISGMRERATLLGGWLTAGPRAERGWRVQARLPIPAATP